MKTAASIRIATDNAGGSGWLGCCFLLFALCFQTQGQTNFSIDWFTIDGGGGTSTGGVYSVSGSVGQPDAGAMSGGGYSLAGGFWGVIAAVQTPGAPYLWVTRTATNAVLVAWPYPSAGFSLQQNANLATTNWVAGPSPVQVGQEWQVLISPPAGNRFYRLKHN